MDGFRSALADARSYLASFPSGLLDPRADDELTFRLSEDLELTLTGRKWLGVFALTNIHFHLVTAYGILRSRGVALDKPDMFAGGL